MPREIELLEQSEQRELGEYNQYEDGSVEIINYDHPDYPLEKRPTVSFVELPEVQEDELEEDR